MIAAKYVARSPRTEEIQLLPYVLDPFQQTQRFLHPEKAVTTMQSFPPHPGPRQKLGILRHLADEMRAMMAELKTMNVEVPEAVIPGAYRYLNMIETELEFSGGFGKSARSDGE